MECLLLVHIEDGFRKFFPRNMIDRLVSSLDAGEYDRVIHFTSHITNEQPIYELDTLIDEEVEWGWGYEPEGFRKHDLPFVIRSSGHDWTYVPLWLRTAKAWLTEANITLGGGYDGECLADMESVLRHLDIPYKRELNFIYP